MLLQLIGVALGVIVGLPIALFGFMRLEERPGRLSWAIFAVGVAITLGPATVTALSHYQQSGSGRYVGH
ncbi:hypothetical protein [Methylobacterium sp. ID0610]|uniref:hypothetical protein n=1 Tax=Methylobacterium carpenticola TaxID=3344827 RepID=UPI003677493C